MKERLIIFSKKGDRGFTLVELIIAVAIAGIITVSIFEIFGGVILNWKKAENRMAFDFKKNNLYILLSKKLDEFYKYKAVKDQNKYFSGRENAIRFLSFYSVKVPYFPVFTEIFVDGDNNLVMEETPFFYDRPDAEIPEPEKTVLWKEVKGFKVSYLLGTNIKKRGSFWSDEYRPENDRSHYLIAIKIEINLGNDEDITVFSYLKRDKNSRTGVSDGLL